MKLYSDQVLVFINTLGLVVSLYSVYVEHKHQDDHSYTALCDITEKISCSTVFSSEYGKVFSKIGLIERGSLFDQTNAFYGVIFYTVYLAVVIVKKRIFDGTTFLDLLLLGLSTISVITSAYLSYALVEELRMLCIACFSIYFFNSINFMVSTHTCLKSNKFM
eukprot:gene6771-9275_t